mmetsp:Transcript_53713/g.143684  ORF Transcript_53713/g.143684 Transcript_53713/m.143684 type:complete len:222 (-) Transcript_53713:612-1277(-)
MSAASRPSSGRTSWTFGLRISLVLLNDTVAGSSREHAICLSKLLKRFLQSSRAACTCSTQSWRKSMASHGMHWPSTTGRQKLWRRRTCTTCTPSSFEKRRNFLARHAHVKSTNKPLKICHKSELKMLVRSMLKWRRCSARWIVRAASTPTPRSFAIRGRRRNSGRCGVASRSSTATRTPSETCSASSEVCRRPTRKCTSTPPRLLRRPPRSWTRCKRQSRL